MGWKGGLWVRGKAACNWPRCLHSLCCGVRTFRMETQEAVLHQDLAHIHRTETSVIHTLTSLSPKLLFFHFLSHVFGRILSQCLLSGGPGLWQWVSLSCSRSQRASSIAPQTRCVPRVQHSHEIKDVLFTSYEELLIWQLNSLKNYWGVHASFLLLYCCLY